MQILYSKRKPCLKRPIITLDEHATLTKYVADVHLPGDHSDYTYIDVICQHDQVDMYKLLAKKLRLSEIECMLVVKVCEHGAIKILTYLVNDGMTMDNNTMLQLVEVAIHYNKVAELIINQFCTDINYSCMSGTLLYIAGRDNNVYIFKLLITHPDINFTKCDNKDNILSRAIANDHINIVKLIFEHIKISQSQWFTAVYLASIHGLRNRQSILEFLVTRPDMDINSDGNYECKNNILHIACSKRDYRLVKLLLTLPNICVNCINAEGKSPLSCACTSGSLATVHLLLGHPGIKIEE